MTQLQDLFSTLVGLAAMVSSLLLNPVSLVALLALYQWRRTGQAPDPLSPGQKRWRQAALVVLVLMVAGFGLCGGAGTLMGLYSVFTASASGEARAYGWMFVIVGGAGVAVAGTLGWLIRRYRRDDWQA